MGITGNRNKKANKDGYQQKYRIPAGFFQFTLNYFDHTTSRAVKYKFIDAILSIMPWYQRYYQGGFNRAEKMAEKKRSINRSNYFNEILKIISTSKK